MKICGGLLAAIMGKKLGARWMPGVPVVADPGQVGCWFRAVGIKDKIQIAPTSYVGKLAPI